MVPHNNSLSQPSPFLPSMQTVPSPSYLTEEWLQLVPVEPRMSSLSELPQFIHWGWGSLHHHACTEYHPFFALRLQSMYFIYMCCFGCDRAQLANDVMFMFLYIMHYIFHLLINTDQGIYIGNRIVCRNIHEVSDVFHIMHVALSSSPLALYIFPTLYYKCCIFILGVICG